MTERIKDPPVGPPRPTASPETPASTPTAASAPKPKPLADAETTSFSRAPRKSLPSKLSDEPKAANVTTQAALNRTRAKSPSAPHTPADPTGRRALEGLNRALRATVASARDRLDPAVAARLKQQEAELAQALARLDDPRSSSAATDLGRARAALTALARELTTRRLTDPALWQQLDAARDAVLSAAARRYELRLEPVWHERTAGPKRLAGLLVSRPDGRPLDRKQAAASFELRTLCYELDRVRFERRFTGGGAMRVDAGSMSLARSYDLLTRYQYGLWPPPLRQPSVSAPPGGREIRYVDSILDAMDAARAGRATELGLTLDALDPGSLPSIDASTLPEAPTASDVPMPNVRAGKAPSVALPTPAIADIGRALTNVAASSPHDPTGPGAATVRAFAAGTDALATAADSLLGQTFVLTPEAATLVNDAVAQAVTLLPGGVGAQLADAIALPLAAVQPGAGVTVADSYTLATPKVWDNGEVQVLLAAGTTLSRDGDGFVATGPELRVFDGTHVISAREGTLRFGADVDLLDLAALDVTSPTSDVAIRGVHAEVGHTTQTALVRADSAIFDFTAEGGAKTTLTGVRFVQDGDRSTFLGADRLFYEQGTDHLAAESFGLTATRDDAGSSLALASGQLDAVFGTSGLTAESLRLELGHTEGAEPTDTALFRGTGIRLGTGDGAVVLAGEASVQVVSTASGSKLEVLTTQTELTTRDGSFGAEGPLRLTASLTPEGALRELDVSGEGVHFDTASGATFASTSGSVHASYGDGERLESVSAVMTHAHFAEGARRIDVAGTSELTVRLGTDGAVTGATAKVTDGDLTFVDGQKTFAFGAGTTAQVDYGAGGLMSRAELTSGTARIEDNNGRWQLEGAHATLAWDENGALERGTLESGHLQTTQTNGTVIDGRGTSIVLDADAGLLRHGELTAATLSVVSPNGSVAALENAHGALDFGADGRLQHASASAGQATWTAPGGEQIQGQGLAIDLGYHDGLLQSARASGAAVQLQRDGGTLDVRGGAIAADFDALGKLSHASFDSEAVRYNGVSPSGTETAVDLRGGLGISLDVAEDGSQHLVAHGADGDVLYNGNAVHFDSVDALDVTTDATGTVTGFDFGTSGKLSIHRGDLTAETQDLHLTYLEGGRVTGAFREGTLDITGQGLTAELRGANFGSSDAALWLHLDEAAIQKTDLAERLDIRGHVESLDVRIDKTAAGNLQNLDVALQNLDLEDVGGIDAIVRSPSTQDRFRLHLGLDAEGNEFRELYMEVPDGGEVRVSSASLDAAIGPGALGLYYDPPTEPGAAARWRLVGRGIDAELTSNKTQVKLDGVDAEVWLDAEKGLVIHELEGKIDATSGGSHYALTATDIHNLAVKFQEYTGTTRGFAVVLEPAEAGSSNLTASVRGDGYGIAFDNMASLVAYATVSKNQATLSVGDPTGRGTVRADYGPLSLEGSRIGLFAQFFEPNAAKVLGETTRHFRGLLTTLTPSESDRYALLPGLYLRENSLELGRLTRGFDANLVVRLPDASYASPEMLYTARTRDSDPYAWGIEGNVGYIGEKRFLTVSAGLEPYSSLDVQTLGHARIGDLALPNHVNVPTAVDASVTYGQKTGPDAGWAVGVGGFVSANGWDANGVRPLAQGVHAEVGYTKRIGGVKVEAALGVTELRTDTGSDRGAFLQIRIGNF